MIYIIGSGPSGVSSAVALVRMGYKVTMLDAGLELEPDRKEMVRQLADQDSADWDKRSVERLKENMRSGVAGIPLKYVYGSSFPYRETEIYIPREGKNVALMPSLAKGGFSNVWGATILPYLADDMANWPIALDDLAPHYQAVLSFMNFTAAKDDLEQRFPLYSDTYRTVNPSQQAQALIADLKRHRDQLRAEGFLFGYSRLAVASQRHRRECVHCGLCMYGCPYNLIYNSALTVDELKKHPNFTYIKDVVVQKLSESHGRVRIEARSRLRPETFILDASRVYVAAGVLSTTRLLLDSMEAYDQPLTIKDSQYFLLPLLRYKGVPGVTDEKLHTLAQVFIEIFDDDLSEQSIHLQVYTYNDLYQQAIRRLLGPSYVLFRSLSNAFMERLLLIQGYLHSDLSPTISVKLEAPKNGSASKLLLEGRENKRTKETLRKLAIKLRKNRSSFKAIPIWPLMKISQPGRGFHSGGTFPMRRRPEVFETDTLGRPVGFEKVHVVDSTVFPSIPASTITLSIMANAHRIASACDESV